MAQKILVVSKDADAVFLLKLGLGKDYEVSAVSFNEESISEVISQRKPDLIIVEGPMPRDREIFAGLRIRQLTDIPIIMLNISEKATARILDLGTRDFLGKDLTAPELKQRIEEAILRASRAKRPQR